jgi:hypothetical protein
MDTMLKLPPLESIKEHFRKKRFWDEDIFQILGTNYAGREFTESALLSRVTLDFGDDSMAVIHELQPLITSPAPVQNH